MDSLKLSCVRINWKNCSSRENWWISITSKNESCEKKIDIFDKKISLSWTIIISAPFRLNTRPDVISILHSADQDSHVHVIVRVRWLSCVSAFFQWYRFNSCIHKLNFNLFVSLGSKIKKKPSFPKLCVAFLPTPTLHIWSCWSVARALQKVSLMAHNVAGILYKQVR